MSTIEQALMTFSQGKMIVVVDDEDRENEGDLICPAITITDDQVNFMTRFGRGLICVALPSAQIERLQLPLMTRGYGESDSFGTAFTYSVDARKGITTGISAQDRALTIRLLVDPQSTFDGLVVPGHIFPLKAKRGGVIERRGHTEAAVDLTRLAGFTPGGVICEILNDDGTMMRLPELKKFAQDHELPIISIDNLINYRIKNEIKYVCKTILPTRYGVFEQSIYHDHLGQEHILMQLGDIDPHSKPFVRIHSECMTGDIFESLRCDCGAQLRQSLELIAHNKAGILIYLRQEGRGIGLTEKIKAYALQDQGLDTIEANHALGHATDSRSYEVALKMLQDKSLHTIRLLTNNPQKVFPLERWGIVVERVPLLIKVNQYNERYQCAKAEKLGHHIPFFNN